MEDGSSNQTFYKGMEAMRKWIEGKISDGRTDSNRYFSFKDAKNRRCGLYVRITSIYNNQVKCDVLKEQNGISKISIGGLDQTGHFEVRTSQLID
jgi:hypothetical protein